jgi:hypothetical protein
MKRGHSTGDITAEKGDGALDDDNGSVTKSATCQQRSKKARRGKLTMEQFDSINDSIDQVISQIQQPSVSYQTDSVCDRQVIDELSSQLSSLRKTTECLGQKIDGLMEYIDCIGKFIVLSASASTLDYTRPGLEVSADDIRT